MPWQWRANTYIVNAYDVRDNRDRQPPETVYWKKKIVPGPRPVNAKSSTCSDFGEFHTLDFGLDPFTRIRRQHTNPEPNREFNRERVLFSFSPGLTFFSSLSNLYPSISFARFSSSAKIKMSKPKKPGFEHFVRHLGNENVVPELHGAYPSPSTPGNRFLIENRIYRFPITYRFMFNVRTRRSSECPANPRT